MARAAALSGIPQAVPLVDAETRFLREHGGATVATAIQSWDPERERQQRGLAAARITSRRLYAFQMPERHQWRIPRWQIIEGRLLPGIGVVAPAIPASLSPLSVEAFMFTAQEELDDRSPVEFLAGAGSPERVADLAAELDEW